MVCVRGTHGNEGRENLVFEFFNPFTWNVYTKFEAKSVGSYRILGRTEDGLITINFLMDADGQWLLSPAYDLTFSSGPGGEQSTMVLGEGRHPGLDHLTRLGLEANLKQRSIAAIIEQTRSALGGWRKLAKQYGVSATSIELIAGKIS